MRTSMREVRVEIERCIRCGACAIVAPATFEVSKKVRVIRQPTTDDEAAACAIAALICPAQAIAEAS
jgi:ferredoxin